MPIVSITKQTRNKGSRGILSDIARRLGVSRAIVSQTNKDPKRSQRIAAVLAEYQRTGRLPEKEPAAR